MTTYVFRDVVAIRGGKKLDPQIIGETISNLEGRDKADALWRAAKSRRHYLHGCYEWDVQLAAEAHWRGTSLQIIRSIYAMDEASGEPAPAFVSIAADGEGRGWYQPQELHGSLSLQLALMKAAQRDLVAFQRRYRMLADVCPLIAEAQERIDAALAARLAAPSASAA